MERTNVETLAEYHAGGVGRCPIPATHDRIAEMHYWWHELARNYHEPDPLRYSLNAFIQGSRNVTFMLKSERSVFKDFSWYESEWVVHAAESDLLRWAKKTRNSVVKQGALMPGSWAELRCVRKRSDPYYEDEQPLAVHVPPFECTHQLFHSSTQWIEETGGEDHAHELERHWELDAFPGTELLELAALVFEEMNGLNALAHEKAGASIRANYEGGRPPCMIKTEKFRVAKFKRRKGRDVWTNEPRGLHQV